MALPSSSSSSSSISHGGFEYDVFLSFRGSDTRYGFTGNLYKALRDKGIRVFFDDREIELGDAITPTLVNAIRQSRIAIPVFSVNYASSSFCLDELVHIMECLKTENHGVFPVFFGVDPGDVRHQTGSYAKALADQEAWFQNNNKEQHPDYMKRMEGWRTALKAAADLKGGCTSGRKTAEAGEECFSFRLGGKVYEHEFIAMIVEAVSNIINRVPLHDDRLVGMESRVKKVKSLLDIGSNNGVLMVGIHGLGGTGKTALARAVYNSIARQFEGLCFLDGDKGGLAHLQETLLRETLGDKDINIVSVHKGIPIIKNRLPEKKVLLILDDVDDLGQLEALAGALNWFRPGSRVIVTAKDQQLLLSHEIKRENTCEVGELNREEALELLRWKAFRTNTVDASYDDILNRAEAYACCLKGYELAE